MALPKRTTKQIAQKYKGNLDYLRKPHAFRMTRLILFLVVAIATVALAFGHYHPKLFSTGPISQNHARFADRCEVCHDGAQPDLLTALTGSKIGHDGQPVPQSLSERAQNAWQTVSLKLHPDEVHKSVNGALTASSSLAALDHACLKCHEPMKLHQPQALSLALRPVRHEISAAEVASCSSCHREHQGPEKMKDPPSSNCVDCHGNPERLRETLVTYKVDGHPPGVTGNVLTFKRDGVKRFVPPRESPHQPVAFTGFATGHPAFGYEQPGVRDPAAISFNHSRHEQKDIPPVNGHKLDCTDCHKPGADGMFMQPVKYAQQCAGCHSLHFSSDVPTLTIPHGDPQKVRDALTSAGLTVLFQDYAVKEKKLMDTASQAAFITEQFNKLSARGIGTTDALLARVFRTGDPPNTTNQFFPGCAKCHVVNFPPGNATPDRHAHEHGRPLAGARPLQSRPARAHGVHRLPRRRAHQHEDHGHPAAAAEALRRVPPPARGEGREGALSEGGIVQAEPRADRPAARAGRHPQRLPVLPPALPRDGRCDHLCEERGPRARSLRARFFGARRKSRDEPAEVARLPAPAVRQVSCFCSCHPPVSVLLS